MCVQYFFTTKKHKNTHADIEFKNNLSELIIINKQTKKSRKKF